MIIAVSTPHQPRIHLPATTKRAFEGALNHEARFPDAPEPTGAPRLPNSKAVHIKNDDPSTIDAARGTKAVRQPREARTATF